MRALNITALALVAAPLAACNDTLPDPDPDAVTGLSAIELLECQESGEGDCPSPEDPDILCCPMSSEATCDCFSVGGTMGEGGTCMGVCDGGGGEREQDENGCWYWTTPSAEGCMMLDVGPDVPPSPDVAPSPDVEPGPRDASPFDAPPHDAGGGADTGSGSDTGSRTDTSVIDAG